MKKKWGKNFLAHTLKSYSPTLLVNKPVIMEIEEKEQPKTHSSTLTAKREYGTITDTEIEEEVKASINKKTKISDLEL